MDLRPPSDKGSTRRRFGNWIRNLVPSDSNLTPQSRHSSQYSASSVTLSTSAGPLSSDPPSNNQKSLTQSVPVEGDSKSGRLGASSPLPADNVTADPLVANPEPTTSDQPKATRNAAWSALENTLRIFKTSANVFPPLESAIGRFIACLDIVQAAASNREDYEELATELEMTVETLKPYVSKLNEQSPEVTKLVSSIEDQVAHISKQRDRGKARQLVESNQDREDVIRCYRKMEKIFHQLQNLVVLRTWENTDKQRMDLLLQSLSPADEVIYNSSYSHTIKRRACTKETREKVQSDLQDWARNPNGAKLYWMNGMAGTGKTTIAYSLCEWLQANKILGASFFFSRGSGSCDDITRLIPTIAHQLARHSGSFRSALLKVLDDDPGASKLDIEQQFKNLLQKPMQEAKDSCNSLEDVVIVIDALDECAVSHEVQLVLQMLMKFAKDLPLKFFMTSRPEYHITEEMKHLPAVIHLHDIERSIVEEDIKKYLTEALRRMSPPPSAGEIAELASRAGKLFIYAATAVRYICPDRMRVDSRARLQAMLAIDSSSSGGTEPGSKYKELDRLYTAVVAEAFSDELDSGETESKQLVLRTIVCLKEPLSCSAIAMLLGVTTDRVWFEVQSLQSVLYLSEKTGLISTLHASFPDYMLTRSRSNMFHCDQSSHSQLLANRCFNTMEQQLQFNICQLESSSVFDKDIPDLHKRIGERISPELFYACRYWSYHLRTAAIAEDLRDRLVDFISHRLLFWMEVLNLHQCRGAGTKTLEQVQGWLKTAGSARAQQQAAEAQDFATRFFSNACSQSTPHIYISALSSYGKASSIYECYWKRTRRLIEMRGTMTGQRSQGAISIWAVGSKVLTLVVSPNGERIITGSQDHLIRAWDATTGNPVCEPFEGHVGPINSVAYSPNGTRIVSGSNDMTVRVWDAHTGSVVADPFEGHKGYVKSVAYSPDGMRIVSGSDDKTIRVWDAHTGSVVAGPFVGHRDYVNSVAYSPDGRHLASGADDETIRVWDAHTGNLVADPLERGYPGGTRDPITPSPPFEGHKGYVKSVAYSPDGKHIVSGSYDTTIRVWDAHTGNIVAGPFEGHTDWVNSVAYSPDGTHIVSGSDDKTIRVWEAHTGNLIAGPFEGHTGYVRSVSYTPNGMHMVSGSDDTTIQVWDAQFANVIASQFEGHTDCIKSIALSPNRKLIASGSDDKTIRVWDAYIGKLVTGPLEGHTGYITSVAYSPDGMHLVSGSDDETVRVWDAHTGNAVTDPFKGHTGPVKSVAYSPDGKHIVSGSSDKTIRVWDAHTGNIATGPVEGHEGRVNSVAYSPDGTTIVSGSDDQTIRVWDAHTGNLVAGPFEGHTGYVKSVVYSPDGKHIVSGSYDRTIRVWDAHAGNVVTGPFEGHGDQVNSVAYSPDGNLIASGSDDGTVLVWDAHTGGVFAGPFPSRTYEVNSVVFSPDGMHVHSGFGFKGTYTRSRGIRTLRVHPPLNQPAALAGTWLFQSDGWVTVNNTPVFWCSPALHDYIPHTWESLVIGPRGTMEIDYQNLGLGNDWAECFVVS